MNEYVAPPNSLFSGSGDVVDKQRDKKRGKKSILFVCAYRGARAQIAEHYCRKFASDRFDAYSAGFEPGPLSGIAVEVMREEHCVLNNHSGKSVFDYFSDHQHFDYVISLCQETGVEQCPIFRRSVDKLYGNSAVHLCWDVGDFRTISGDEAEKLTAARLVRDTIANKVRDFVSKEHAPMIASISSNDDTLKLK